MLPLNKVSDLVEGLEKRMEEMQDGFRRIAQENQQLLTTISGLADQVTGVRAEVKALKTETERKAQQFAAKKF